MSISVPKILKLEEDLEKGTLLDDGNVKKEVDYLSPFLRTYENSDSFSPAGLDATINTEPLGYSGVHVMHGYRRQPIRQIMTLDIETWGLRSEMLHFGILYRPEATDGKTYRMFRQWHADVKCEKIRQGKRKGQYKDQSEIDWTGNQGIVEMIEEHLLNMPQTDQKQTDVVFAHNGGRFDLVGLAYHIQSNVDIDPEYAEDPELFEKKLKIVFEKTGTRVTQHYRKSQSILLPWKGKNIHPRLKHPNVYCQPEPVFEFTPKDPKFTSKVRGMHPHVRPYLKRCLFESPDNSIIGAIRRKVPFDAYGVKRPSSKRGQESKYADIRWEVQRIGPTAFINVKWMNNTVRLVDSIHHLGVPLSALGAKGKTPLQYTDPEEWLDQEMTEGRLDREALLEMDSDDEDKLKVQFWFDHLDEAAVDYCKTDCRILYEALMDLRDLYRSVVVDPETHEKVDPLSYLTASQAALAAMVILSNTSGSVPMKKMAGRASEPRYFVAHTYKPSKNQGRWYVCQDEETLASHQLSHQYKRVPYFDKTENVLCPGGFYQYGKTNSQYKHVVFGGRTEIFQPRNKRGTRIVSIDANSMYPSQMNDANLTYADPRYLRALDRNLVGREEILEHLKSFSGMYRIKTRPAVSDMVNHRFPIFPIRMEGGDVDSRLAFPSWKGKIDIYVTGEELRYFLETTPVENDDITVIGEDSLYSTLLKSTQTPFHTFSGAFYKKRREFRRELEKAEKELERLRSIDGVDEETIEALERRCHKLSSKVVIAKLLLNAGGYGVNIQVNNARFSLTEGDHANNRSTLKRMYSMSKEWHGWSKLKDMNITRIEDINIKDLFRIARQWAGDHYRTTSRKDVHRDGMKPIQRLTISLPSYLAPHSLRAFGAAITSHARVCLHRAIAGIDRVQFGPEETATEHRSFGVLYCDTDSIHFEVPEDMSDERVQELLAQIKVPGSDGTQINAIRIGDNLGEWKLEEHKPNPNLLTEEVAAHLEKEGLSTTNLDGFYLAPKHYYFTTKPDSKGYRHVLKDVVKGIPSNSTMMRVAMVSYKVQSTRLGDPFGLAMERQISKNLMPAIEGIQPKRRKNNLEHEHTSGGKRRQYFYSDELSQPIYLEKPSWIPTGATYLNVISMIQDQVGMTNEEKSRGIYNALKEYKNCMADMKMVSRLNRDLSEKFQVVTRSISDEVGPGKNGSLYTEFNRLMKSLKDAGIVDRDRSGDDQLPL